MECINSTTGQQSTQILPALAGIGELLAELVVSFTLPLDQLLQHTLLPMLQDCVSLDIVGQMQEKEKVVISANFFSFFFFFFFLTHD